MLDSDGSGVFRFDGYDSVAQGDERPWRLDERVFVAGDGVVSIRKNFPYDIMPV